MSRNRTVELANGHEVNVTLGVLGSQWVIELIDLETNPYRKIDWPDGGPYVSENDALRAAAEIAETAMKPRKS